MFFIIISAKDVESVVNLISLILRKCSQKNRLPLSTIKSSFKFELPDGAVGKEMATPNGGRANKSHNKEKLYISHLCIFLIWA